ncbi:MAG: DNA polymerase I [Actinobacteria bacterium]|nr:DNA polymerase I [Actinomycetota bacterium]NBP22017.1 DNA polymerase I [Actinomycetota bacterium]NCZ72159.1 DNA polymerase I [Actinomycetota bacterium]NDE26496.1 DNA polymerase I [Actinomycetota bacterium]NDE36155.1 DNA polymerase I [Actinomycetota bacterium]
MNKKLLILDGHSMAFRAFYALPVENFSTSAGQPTNAIYGFASMLINLIRDEKPTHIATAFDVSRKTFRSEKFPEYKANRAATPEEFRSQVSYINELLDAFEIPHFELEGYEADDVIATFVKKFSNQAEIYICTGDRDSFQLVSDRVTVLYPKKGVTELARMTPDAVLEKYGLTPKQYPDFAALRGDPSDNLPSIPGVGEKTATKWIQEFGTLSELIAKVDIVPGKAGGALRAGLASVITNRELTQLKSDLPLSTELDELSWSGVEISKVNQLFEKLEIKALKARVAPFAKDGQVKEVAAKKKNLRDVTNFEFEKALSDSTGFVGLLLSENQAAISIEPDTVLVAPIGDVASAISGFKNFIFHGAKQKISSKVLKTVAVDTEVAAYLINAGSRNIALSDLLQKYLGIVSNNSSDDLFTLDWDPSITCHLPGLWEVLSKELEGMNCLDLFNQIEMPTMHILAAMEATGIAIDRQELQSLLTFFAKEEAEATSLAYKSVGHEFNAASPKQLQAVLFEELKLPKTKRIKTGFSTDAESLEWLFSTTKHPVLASLLRIREVGKLKTTVEGLLNSTKADNRIHTTFQQTTTATGRLSSTDPNLQNIPIRSDEGRRIRNCFVAQEPFVDLLTADYSQIEMRIMAHLSDDKGLLEAFRTGEDLHSTVGAQVFDVPVAQVDADMRRQIKAMSYGLAYGLSSYGLAQQLDISPTDASILMSKYFERFGGIQDYLKEVVKIARDKGYTETILGRRRYLPDLSHENRGRREMAERMALNAPIQGSAADIIKVAMLNVEKAMRSEKLSSRLLLQVHDELIFEIAKGEHEVMEALVRKQMGSAFELKAPLDVNIGFGKSWDLAAH